MSLQSKAALLVPAFAAALLALPSTSFSQEVVVESGYTVAPSGVRSRSGLNAWSRTRGGQQPAAPETPAAPVAPVVQAPPPCTVTEVYFEWVNVPVVSQVQTSGGSSNTTSAVRSRSGARGSAPTVNEVVTYQPTLMERTRQVPCPAVGAPGSLGLVGETGGGAANVEPPPVIAPVAQIPTTQVPVPSVVALLGIGAVGLAAFARRRRG